MRDKGQRPNTNTRVASDHCTVQPAWNSLSVWWLWNSASLRVWQCRPGPSPCGSRGTRSLSVGGRDSVVELDAGTLLSVAMAVLPVDQATDLVAKLQEVDIFYLKILSAPTVASFTGLLDVRSEASSPVWDILGLDVKALTEASEDPDVRAAVGRFASLAKDNTTGKRLARELRRLSDERSQMLAIIREVLLPLTGQEIMKVNIREYPESVVIGEPVHRIHLGIGSPLTWYGAPDGRCAIDLVNVDAVEEEEDSSGSKTPVEMKMSAFGRPNINQVPSFSPSYNRKDTQQQTPWFL